MNDRQARLLYTVAGLVLAVILTVVTDSRLTPSRSTSLWFEVLVWILIAAFIVEPFFSGPATAFVNAISVIFICLAAGFKGPFEWWVLLTTLASLALVLLIVDFVLRDPSRLSTDRTQRIARVSRQIAVALGSWRFILLASLALSLASFNEPFKDGWIVSTILLLYVFALVRLDPRKMIALLAGTDDSDAVSVFAERVLAPAEIVATVARSAAPAPGSLLKVYGSGYDGEGLVLGSTYFQGKVAIRVFVQNLARLLQSSEVNDLSLSHGEELADSGFERYRSQLQEEDVVAVGTVADGSSIAEMRVELFADVRVELGQLMWTLDAGGRTYWQVLDATVHRESWGGDTHRCVVASSVQLGRWNDARVSFETVESSPRHTDLVFAGPAGPGDLEMNHRFHVIARVPTSDFPICVNLRELSLHHVALLGTTGTGKTHLSFAIAAALASAGTKVICVDTTGQYVRRFQPPAHLQLSLADVIGFLSGTDSLAVFMPDPNEHTILEGNALAQLVFDWAKALPPPDPDATARCLIVFEEAQSFVPEGFVVDDWNLKAKAQDTSRIIMESRKFGLGFMLISQRTAMVTKSALSQCNTVVAFQAVDQTGLEYLEQLCGRTLARGIPTLPVQTAITMGRGMTSKRPIIGRVEDAALVIP